MNNNDRLHIIVANNKRMFSYEYVSGITFREVSSHYGEFALYHPSVVLCLQIVKLIQLDSCNTIESLVRNLVVPPTIIKDCINLLIELKVLIESKDYKGVYFMIDSRK